MADPEHRLLRLYYGPAKAGGPWLDADDMYAEDPMVRRSRKDGDLTTPLSEEDPEAWVAHLRAARLEADRG